MPESLVVDQGAVSLSSLRDTVTISARVLDGLGQSIPGVELSWALEGDSVLAAVPGTEGRYQSVANGTATLVVALVPASPVVNQSRGYHVVPLERRIPVEVRQIPVALALDTLPRQLWSLGSEEPTALGVLDARGNSIVADSAGGVPAPDVAWSSADSTVVSVDAEGRIRARADGVTDVTAVLDTLRATQRVRVSATFDFVVCYEFSRSTGETCQRQTLTKTERRP